MNWSDCRYDTDWTANTHRHKPNRLHFSHGENICLFAIEIWCLSFALLWALTRSRARQKIASSWINPFRLWIWLVPHEFVSQINHREMERRSKAQTTTGMERNKITHCIAVSFLLPHKFNNHFSYCFSLFGVFFLFRGFYVDRRFCFSPNCVMVDKSIVSIRTHAHTHFNESSIRRAYDVVSG